MQRSWLLLAVCGVLSAQVPDPDVPLTTFKVDVVAKTAKAINYRHRSGATRIDFAGTASRAISRLRWNFLISFRRPSSGPSI
jgi:hypothetical protein